ncbi:hypothetical protein SAMN05660826_01933 [Caldanaerovirga acetigignens]|uniref:Uncharacterized protein n=1 Tax=Caldanaerovirga acetigignens TaxID=447595 RepID=A0A1M7LJW6_9FIRM|nr:hypothetical protein SAMN05660826_01933 [Caldanaerovirga acetigignens]
MFFARGNSPFLQRFFPRHRWGIFMLTYQSWGPEPVNCAGGIRLCFPQYSFHGHKRGYRIPLLLCNKHKKAMKFQIENRLTSNLIKSQQNHLQLLQVFLIYLYIVNLISGTSRVRGVLHHVLGWRFSARKIKA